MILLFLFIALLAGCATAPARATPDVRPTPQPVAVIVNPVTPAAKPVVAAAAPAPVAAPAPADAEKDDADDASDDAAEGDDGEVGEEGESHVAQAGDQTGPVYTKDLSDADLEKLWKQTPSKLGSMSVGFVDAGRLVNGEAMRDGPGWVVISPEKCWGTHETVGYLHEALAALHAKYPNAAPCRVNQISGPEGGWLRPHKSHQNGRDVDIGFYYPGGAQIHARAREKVMDVPMNWALLKSIVTHGDVQFVLVDKRVQKVLFDYAIAQGEDRAWLDSLFHAGADSLVKHARHHRDHFHVRYYNPRAQELGRRVAPLLAQQPEFNVAMHKVKHGDTLGHIALKYGSSVQGIKKANHMKNNFLRLGQVLQVPLHGACTHCPVPPEVIVPPRHLPPDMLAAAQAAQAVAVKTVRAPAPVVVARVENPVTPKVTAVVNLAIPARASQPGPQPGGGISGALPSAPAR